MLPDSKAQRFPGTRAGVASLHLLPSPQVPHLILGHPSPGQMACPSVRKDAWVPPAAAPGADWQRPPLGAESPHPLQEAWPGLGVRGGRTPAGNLRPHPPPQQVKGHTLGSPRGPERRRRGVERCRVLLGRRVLRHPPAPSGPAPTPEARPATEAALVPLPFLPLPTDKSPPRGRPLPPRSLVSRVGTLGTHCRACESKGETAGRGPSCPQPA